MLDVSDVMRRVFLCMLETMEVNFVCWRSWRRCVVRYSVYRRLGSVSGRCRRCWRCWRRCTVYYSVCWRQWRVGSVCWRYHVLDVLTVMRRVLLCMLEAVESELCLLEVLEEMRCMLLCTVEAVEGGLRVPGRRKCWRCWGCPR